MKILKSKKVVENMKQIKKENSKPFFGRRTNEMPLFITYNYFGETYALFLLSMMTFFKQVVQKKCTCNYKVRRVTKNQTHVKKTSRNP